MEETPVIVLNTKLSSQTGFFVFETYTCRNSINKSHKYNGGRVVKVNLEDFISRLMARSSSYESLCLFLKNHALNISVFRLCLHEENGVEFLRLFFKSGLIFFSDRLDWFRIDDYFFYDSQENISVNRGISFQIGKHCFKYKSAEGKLICSKTTAHNDTGFGVPVPLVVTDGTFFELNYRYSDTLVGADSDKYILSSKNTLILRNFELENSFVKRFESSGFRRKSGKTYWFTGSSFNSEILEQLGCSIEYIDRSLQVNHKAVVITANQDWFDLRLSDIETDSLKELSDLINLNYPAKTKKTDKNSTTKVVKLNLEQLLKLYGHPEHFQLKLELCKSSSCSLKLKHSEKIATSLREFQQKGALWLKWHILSGLGCCLADDMGTGKTIQIIAALSDEEVLSRTKHVLIVTPPVILANWQHEFEGFSSIAPVVYHGVGRSSILNDSWRVMLTSYQTACLDRHKLNELNFDLIIFDEIQYVKNNKAQLYLGLYELKSKCKIGLSGTPMENRIEELWNVLHFLNPLLSISKSRFIDRYQYAPYRLKDYLTPFILRRTKFEVLPELRDKTHEILKCYMNSSQRRLYDALCKAVKNSLHSSYSSNANLLRGLLALRQVCDHPKLLSSELNPLGINDSAKLEMLILKLRELYDAGEKVIVFSQFTSMLSLVKAELENENFPYFYLDGKTRHKADVAKEFERSENGIFLISLKAGGVGLNLTSARYVILCEPWWNPFAEFQAEDRTYRLGQSQPVIVVKLIVPDSIEEKMLNLQQSKLSAFTSTLDGLSSPDFDLKNFIEEL